MPIYSEVELTVVPAFEGWRAMAGHRAHLLGRIDDHRITRIDELLPWHYTASAA
jgi:hypothetical protein